MMSAAVHMGRISAFGMTIPESDHAVPALQNVFFPDDAAVEIAAQVDQGLIAVAGVLAVNHPLFWAIMGDGQVVLHQKLKELCSENLGQCLVAEEIFSGFYLPQAGFQVDTRSRHDHMDVGMIVQCSGLGVEDGGESRRASEFAIVFSKGFEEILCCGEHQGIHRFLIFPGQIPKLLRQSEGDQVVRARQPFVQLIFYPLLALMILAMGAVSVTAGMGDIGLSVALVIGALSQHVRPMFQPAPGHGFQCVGMAWQKIFPVPVIKTV